MPQPQNDNYDYSTDPLFLAATPMQQHTYLMENDKDYAQGNAKDRMAYLSSLQQPTQFERDQNAKAQQLKSLPSIAGQVLPVVGGIAGGAVGAGAGLLGGGPVGAGVGAGVGGGLGAAGGEVLRQQIMSIGGDKPSLTQVGMAGVAGALGEAPGGVMVGFGNRAAGKLAATAASNAAADAAEAQARAAASTARTKAGWAQLINTPRAANEFGDVAKAIARNAPQDVSKSGMRATFLTDNAKLSRQLTGALSSASGTADLDGLLLNTRNNAAIADGIKPGVAKMIDSAIDTARAASGITNPQVATVKQLADFRQALRAYNPVDPSGTMQIVKPLLKDAYTQVNGHIKAMSPQAADLLDKMQDNHAAISALKYYGKQPAVADVASAVHDTYKPGYLSKLGMAAAAHPTATAVTSPAATAVLAPVLASAFTSGRAALAKTGAKIATGQIWQ